jgi:hypothetical protein
MYVHYNLLLRMSKNQNHGAGEIKVLRIEGSGTIVSIHLQRVQKHSGQAKRLLPSEKIDK